VKTWNAHQKHAQFAQKIGNCLSTGDQQSRGGACLFNTEYRLAHPFLRSRFLIRKKLENIQTCEHVKQFTTAARLLEDSHIPYDALVFGHQDFLMRQKVLHG